MIIRDMQSTGGNAERETYTLMSGFSVAVSWASTSVGKMSRSRSPRRANGAPRRGRWPRVSFSRAPVAEHMATDDLIEWVASRHGQKVAVEEMQRKGHLDGYLLFWRDVNLCPVIHGGGSRSSRREQVSSTHTSQPFLTHVPRPLQNTTSHSTTRRGCMNINTCLTNPHTLSPNGPALH